jgi:predicted transglutaminase-like cysteine proteinase
VFEETKMKRPLRLAVGLLILCWGITGCVKQHPVQPAVVAPQHSAKALSPEAQAELDRLNFQCANSTVWSSEFDRLERPWTQPPNYKVSGECRAFANDCKKRLAALGVKVKWNSDKKCYESQE